MRWHIVRIGSSAGFIVPKNIRSVFEYRIGDTFKSEINKNKIILTKLKTQPVQKSKELEPIMEDAEPEPIIIARKRVPIEEPELIVVKYGNCKWCGKYNKLTRIKGGKCFYCDECKEMLEENQKSLDAAKQTEVIEDEPIEE
jgi:antitoxin component of MazEF toxin-antitoxin module